MMPRHTTWALERGELEHIEELLQSFLRDARGRSAFLVDRSGQVLGRAGDAESVDPLSFGSLAAADFAASGQLAHHLGERDFDSLFHQGELASLLLSAVGANVILAALFDSRTTVGMIRLRARTLVPRLTTVLEVAAARSRSSRFPGMAAEWAGEAADEIDRLFAD